MSITRSQVTALILAGGKGERMQGRDKGLVIYKEKPLIEHVINRITPQIDHLIINANRNLSTYHQYTQNNQLTQNIINDELSDFQGPLAGFMSAMKSCNTEYILTMPCDTPFLPEDYASRMIKALSSHSKQNNKQNIVVAHDGERLQSVHALIPVSLLNNLQDYLNHGDRKIGLWYQQNNKITADFSDKPEAFFNINTETQLLK